MTMARDRMFDDMSATSGTAPVVGRPSGTRRRRWSRSSRCARRPRLIDVPLALLRNRREAARLAARGNLDAAVMGGFGDRALRPLAGVDVGGLCRGRAAGSSARWRSARSRHPAGTAPCSSPAGRAARAGGFGLGLDRHELLAAMAHLHHRHAGAVPVEHFRGGLAQDGFGKGRRPRAEVERRVMSALSGRPVAAA